MGSWILFSTNFEKKDLFFSFLLNENNCVAALSKEQSSSTLEDFPHISLWTLNWLFISKHGLKSRNEECMIAWWFKGSNPWDSLTWCRKLFIPTSYPYPHLLLEISCSAVNDDKELIPSNLKSSFY